MNFQDSLASFKPQKDFFIGIDSDGCVFDSMDVKQKEFFIPLSLKYFDLWPLAGILRRTWEFVNLHSISRGSNRFISLIRVFELMNEDEKVRNSKVRIPDTKELRIWINSETKLSNKTLRDYCEKNNNKDLTNILIWSEAVNEEIGKWLNGITPFSNARKAIRMASEKADLVVVSQTPSEAIIREWTENDLTGFIKAIAGQEQGTKSEHLQMAAIGRYNTDKILLIGDAIGDLEAALSNGIHFYPIIPGNEDESWEKFTTESFQLFIRGEYNNEYEKSLIDNFRRCLPDKPWWQ